ncbi:MAG: hypothetical protein GTO14_25035 [Anaerolineales bacterium]|nr:hypothetical protein [Anaerolineales bacterium]
MSNESYMYRRRRLLRNFDKTFNRVKPLLCSWLGEEDSRILIQESRQEYETLIPRIPFIGRNNPLLVFFLPTSRYLAVYRTLQRLGYTIEDAGYLSLQIGSNELRAIPSIARRVIGYLWFSSWFKDRIKLRAADSISRRYPGNFVLKYVEGDGHEFDYGVDYIECASCKFLEAEGAFELAPYVCAVDKTASELLGWGLKRTMTLAEGSKKCDFRFKSGGKTHVVLPQSLRLRT